MIRELTAEEALKLDLEDGYYMVTMISPTHPHPAIHFIEVRDNTEADAFMDLLAPYSDWSMVGIIKMKMEEL